MNYPLWRFWARAGGCWVAPAQALTLAVLSVLVVSGTLAQVDTRLPPLSYSVWVVDYQGGCLTFNIILFLVYSVLNFGIVQVSFAQLSNRACSLPCSLPYDLSAPW